MPHRRRWGGMTDGSGFACPPGHGKKAKICGKKTKGFGGETAGAGG